MVADSELVAELNSQIWLQLDAITSNYIYCVLLSINQFKAHLQSYPCPINIHFLWNFGFLLAISFILQIVSGILLSSYYSADALTAFNSIQYISREVNLGWLARYIHTTGASLVFIFYYIHILRSLVYKSYIYLPIVWISGLVLFLIGMAIAFLGYVLPWGQMSFWGATVITNLLSPVPNLVPWICGGYYVSNPTLHRFFVLHFVLPFICLGILVVHIFYLHQGGSNEPLGTNSALRVPFVPNILALDLKGLNVLIILLLIQVGLGLLQLSHPDNSCILDRFATPLQIVPEWYFLSFYMILKTVPDKTSGLLLMFGAIQFLFLLTEQRSCSTLIVLKCTHVSRQLSLISIFSYCFYSLLICGAQLPQQVYVGYGRIFSFYYFAILLVLVGFNIKEASVKFQHKTLITLMKKSSL